MALAHEGDPRSPRFDPSALSPLAYRAMLAMEGHLATCGLDAWPESPYSSDRERAALAWAESLTRITSGHVPDAVYESTRAYFSEKELSDLMFVVTTINAWNRLAISARTVPGTYQPAHRATRATDG